MSKLSQQENLQHRDISILYKPLQLQEFQKGITLGQNFIWHSKMYPCESTIRYTMAEKKCNLRGWT